MIKIQQKYTGEVLAQLQPHSLVDVEQMLQTATKLKNDPLVAYERIKILQNLVPLMQEKHEFFAKLIANEGGKPLKDARVEVTRAIDGVNIAIAAIRNIKGDEVPMDLTQAGVGRLAFTTMEAIGVVVAVSAFNHPLNLTVHQVIPAVATGCPVIIKPSSNTPLCALEFVKLLELSGLPKGWAQVALTDNIASEKLVTDKRVAFFSFIGSARVGWLLKSKLANGTRCALEHGGVAPVILADYQDIDGFVAGVAKSGFYHAGQVCVSAQRVFVSQIQAETVAQKIAKIANTLVVGDAHKEQTDIGPLISSKEVDRVEQWVNEAINEGAILITGGKRINDVSYQATVLLNPNKNSKVSTREIFGPVICVYSYEHIDEAITQANSLEVSFQSSIFTDNISTAIKTAKKLQASAVMINDYTTFRVDWMPFAGRKNSGYGVGGIEHTMKDMLEHKLLVIKE
jgi:acyl-CoA reductase-like NAD-dependent aldehyde dehydrogenase